MKNVGVVDIQLILAAKRWYANRLGTCANSRASTMPRKHISPTSSVNKVTKADKTPTILLIPMRNAKSPPQETGIS